MRFLFCWSWTSSVLPVLSISLSIVESVSVTVSVSVVSLTFTFTFTIFNIPEIIEAYQCSSSHHNHKHTAPLSPSLLFFFFFIVIISSTFSTWTEQAICHTWNPTMYFLTPKTNSTTTILLEIYIESKPSRRLSSRQKHYGKNNYNQNRNLQTSMFLAILSVYLPNTPRALLSTASGVFYGLNWMDFEGNKCPIQWYQFSYIWSNLLGVLFDLNPIQSNLKWFRLNRFSLFVLFFWVKCLINHEI